MVPGILVIIIIFVLQGIGQYFTWLYWLQVKEYRFDRFGVFLRSYDGRRELILSPIIGKFFILTLGFFYNTAFFLYILGTVILATYFGILFLTKRVRKPVFTKRVWRILLITLVLIGLSSYVSIKDFWVFIVVSEFSLLFGPFIGIYLTNFSVKATLEREKREAENKLKVFSPTVIAIAGSYGKTTTKDFISQFLSSEYKVLSTFKNQNTHFGILRRINSELQSDHKFLVVEVGAYKKGEIKGITEVLRPDVTVITGIEPQHVELFGSLGNLKKAKFELVEALREGGSAFFNLSNPEAETLRKWSERNRSDVKNFTYGVNGAKNFDVTSQIVNAGSKGVTFRLIVGKEERLLKTNVPSKRLVENVTGAIAVARKFGISWSNITKTCQQLELPEGTLNIFKTVSGWTVIDDSYNSTPHGMKAALEVLAQTEGDKKFILTTGVIELGKESEAVHKKLGKMMEEICDFVLLRNSEFILLIKSGMSDGSKVRLMRDPQDMINFFEKEGSGKSVVLIEGRLPQVVEYFKSKKQ